MNDDRFLRVLMFADAMGYTSVEVVERHAQTVRAELLGEMVHYGLAMVATQFLRCGGSSMLWNLDAVCLEIAP